MLRCGSTPKKTSPIFPQIAAVRKHFVSEVDKSPVLPAAVGLPGEWKMVEIADSDARNQMIRVKATPITALPNECPKRFSEIDKTLSIVNGDLFKHLAPETMCPTWLFDYMTRANILISGSRTVIMNLQSFCTWRMTGARMKIQKHHVYSACWLMSPLLWLRILFGNRVDLTLVAPIQKTFQSLVPHQRT